MSLQEAATIILAFLTLSINYGSRGTFGLFLKPLAAEFNTSRGAVSLILSINMLTFGALAFLTGYMIDRFGTRLVLVIGAILAIVAFGLSTIASGLLGVIIALGVIFGLATCFLSQITALSLLVKGPKEGDKAFSMGLVGTGPGLGSLLLVPPVGIIIASMGWRAAMLGLGGLFAGYLLLLLLLFGRTSGSQGLGPSDMKTKRDSVGIRMPLQGKNIYLLFFSFMLMSIAIYGVLSQVAAYATDKGMSISEASFALGLISGIRVIASPLMGWLSDRVKSQKALGAKVLISAILGIILIYMAGSPPVLYLASLIVGTAYASYIPIFPSITRTLFGSELFGRAWGLITMGGSIGAALGSWAGGYLHDLQGNYDMLWMILAGCLLFSSLALLSLDTSSGYGR